MTYPPIIGISGPAGSGKDTLARLLHERYGYAILSLATPMKRLLNARFGWTMDQWEDRKWKETPHYFHGCFQEPGVPPEFFEPLSPRQWAQWLGTEVGRNTFGKNVWVDALEREWIALGWPRLVIPDIRFDNEASYVKTQGGFMVRIERPGTAPVASHSSESGVSARLLDAVLCNTDTPDFLLGRLWSTYDALTG